jgi:ligand-binding SRPBCC domain-containing protein
MTIYELHRSQILPIEISEAWSFFSSPYNLEKITPAYMKFQIISRLENKPIYEGLTIEYIVRPLLGIPLKWKTEITDVNAPHCFVDKQAKGPYSIWEHRHTFKEVAGGVEMTDHVKYGLPLGILGKVAHAVRIKKQLEEVFDYRTKVLTELFPKK